MGSIKNNLSMIDKQLVTVFNHFETKKKTDSDSRKKHLENIVSKIIYDLFANKMKNSIGMTVDFKKSCETIIRYAFVSEDYESEDKYTEVLIKALTRLSEITNESIDFNSDIMFERKIKFEDEFTKRLGAYFQSVINNEFSWNLFFRILFTLEPLNNAGDFEKFLEFLRVNFIESKYISKQKEVLKEKFKERYIEIENAITLQTVESLIDVDKIDIVYDYNIYDINDEVEDIYRQISNNISSIDQWEKESVRILDKLDAEIKDIFA
nr:hypothetical protein [Clostridium butyricum]